jgi:hypothetical protein
MGTFKLFLIFLPISTFAAVFATSKDSKPRDPVSLGNEAAASAASRLSAHFPKTILGGIKIAAPKAEGDVLVFNISFSREFMGDSSFSESEATFKEGLCKSGAGFTSLFRKGGKLRFDQTTGGDFVYKGKVVDSCPAT